MAQQLRKQNLPRRYTQKMMRDFQILKVNYELIKDRYEEEKKALVDGLQSDTLVQEEGPLMLILDIKESRHPSWKNEYIKITSIAQAEYIISKTEKTQSFTPLIKIKPTIEV